MKTPRLLLLLLTTTMMMMTMMLEAGALTSSSLRSPFRGELSAVPRGLDVLLRNIAPRSRSRPARQPGNDLGAPRSSSPGIVSQLDRVVAFQGNASGKPS